MYTQPELTFALGDLEPFIDEQTMDLHYNKHHKGYIDKYNAAIEGTEFADKELDWVIQNLDQAPEDKATAIRNNGCQAWNHSFFWTMMKKDGGGEPTGALAEAINEKWGSIEAFKEEFTTKAATVFGSGWCWLIVKDGQLEIMQTSNEGCPLTAGYTPIMTIDVWEHAYYLKYQNRRPEFIQSWFEVVNWNKINEYYEQTR